MMKQSRNFLGNIEVGLYAKIQAYDDLIEFGVIEKVLDSCVFVKVDYLKGGNSEGPCNYTCGFCKSDIVEIG